MKAYFKESLPKMLRDNPYPGRGIALGVSAGGTRAVLVYFIMGRSENSRNRIFIEESDDVVIVAYDESKVEDPSLIIYSPIKVWKTTGESVTIVTNGDQTDTIYRALMKGQSFEDALKTRCFEPDAPNYTPRISGMFSSPKKRELASYNLSILKRGDAQGTACVREFFEYPLVAGTGHFISTYITDDSPLPSFEGEPIRIAIPDDLVQFAEDIWNNLHEANKISLYVRSIELHTGHVENILMNKHTQK